MHNLRLFLFGLVLSAAPVFALADDILTVSDGNEVKNYSFEDLSELPQTDVRTSNLYVEGETLFQGPLLRQVLDDFEVVETDEIELTAINDYSVTIPAADALNYDVILAIRQEGETMSVRDKGPIWLIYPMSDHEELNGRQYNDRLIWQLQSIEVK